jgi:hypothetical protein
MVSHPNTNQTLFSPWIRSLGYLCNSSMWLGEVKVESCVLQNMSHLATYLSHCLLDPNVSHTNVSEGTLFDCPEHACKRKELLGHDEPRQAPPSKSSPGLRRSNCAPSCGGHGRIRTPVPNIFTRHKNMNATILKILLSYISQVNQSNINIEFHMTVNTNNFTFIF